MLITQKKLIDVHAHLDAVNPIKEAIGRARVAGVKQIVAVGMDLDSNRKIMDSAFQCRVDIKLFQVFIY